MLELVRYWIIGIVTLAACVGVFVLAYMSYEFIYEEFFGAFAVIAFLLMPLLVGLIASKIKERYID